MVCTPIHDVHLKNIKATKTEFLSRILGQKELPVKNIFLNNVEVDTITEQKHSHENVLNFNEIIDIQ